MKILISDSLSKQGVELLEKAGFTVVVKSKMPKDELFKEIKDADGLIVRSGTKVTEELIAAAEILKVIGRAGSGLDNVDTPAAPRRGIVVMNTPGGNTVTTAEHTMSMICAMSRRIPQATTSVKAGKWEKDKFMGGELFNKVTGLVGGGQLGSQVTDWGLVHRHALHRLRSVFGGRSGRKDGRGNRRTSRAVPAGRHHFR